MDLNRIRVAVAAAFYLLLQGLRLIGRQLGALIGLRPLPRRTVDYVRDRYNQRRSNRSLAGGLDAHVYGDAVQLRPMIANGRLSSGTSRDYRKRLLARLEPLIRKHIEGHATPVVVEFGSGAGENLLYLKKRFPQIRAIGLDLSPVSVKLARAASRLHDIPVEFYEADVTAALPEWFDRCHISFSVRALEDMPRIFHHAVDNMLARTDGAVLFLEPVVELYPRTPSGMMARLSARQDDRLHGLHRYLQRLPVALKIEQLTFAHSPLAPMTLIEVSPVRVNTSASGRTMVRPSGIAGAAAMPSEASG